jgi:hypothetical protein
MRRTTHLILLGAAWLFGCAQLPPAAAPAAPPFAAVADLKQLMEWVIDPAVDVVWDSVKSISTETGTKEVAPHTDEEWDAVRNAAMTVAESANLLMIPGRARDGREWMNAARGLSVAADRARTAAEARNVDALFAAGGDIYNACSACHRRYAPHLSN